MPHFETTNFLDLFHNKNVEFYNITSTVFILKRNERKRNKTVLLHTNNKNQFFKWLLQKLKKKIEFKRIKPTQSFWFAVLFVVDGVIFLFMSSALFFPTSPIYD